MDKLMKRPFKHKVIKNFLDKTEVKLLTDYCRIRHRLNDFSFDIKPTNNNADTRIYGDPFTETLLVQKREIMEKETGYKLLPTYSYWRMRCINNILSSWQYLLNIICIVIAYLINNCFSRIW